MLCAVRDSLSTTLSDGTAAVQPLVGAPTGQAYLLVVLVGILNRRDGVVAAAPPSEC